MDKKSKDKNIFKIVIIFLFIVLTIINLFPLVMIIIEIVLSSKNDCDINGYAITIIGMYLFYFLMLFSLCCDPEILYISFIGLFSLYFLLGIFYLIEYFLFFSYTHDNLPEFMKSFIKFRIIGDLIVEGIDILFAIIIGIIICYDNNKKK